MKQNLRVEGEVVALSLEEDEENPRANLDQILSVGPLVEAARVFRAVPPTEVRHSADQRVLCVLQREYAVARVAVVDVLGGDDCTNTALLFVRLGACVACGHFDYGEGLIGTDKCGVAAMVDALERAAGADADETASLDVWIVGGFIDDKRNSAFVVGMLLAALNAQKRTVELHVVCAEALNDEVREDNVHYPIVMGAAYFKSEGKVLPAHFTHLGPGVGMRTALPCAGKEELTCCYDTQADEICIKFPYSEFEFVSELLVAPDEFYLENLAGCPKQEPPRFCSTLRAGLEFLAKYPTGAEAFANGPVRFKRSAVGAWVKKQ